MTSTSYVTLPTPALPPRPRLRLAWEIDGDDAWTTSAEGWPCVVECADGCTLCWRIRLPDGDYRSRRSYGSARAARRGCERALARLAAATFEDSLRAWLRGTSQAQRGADARRQTQPKGAGR